MTHSFSGKGGSVAAINIEFLIAATCGSIAWISWPSTPEWWQLGILSALLWVACVTHAIKGFRLILRRWQRGRVIAAFDAQGKAPKSAAMASSDKLQAMGMFDE